MDRVPYEIRHDLVVFAEFRGMFTDFADVPMRPRRRADRLLDRPYKRGAGVLLNARFTFRRFSGGLRGTSGGV